MKFRLSPEEHEQLIAESVEQDLSLSELVRYKMGFPLKRDYRQLLFHLSRIGNNANQLAKIMNVARKIKKIDNQQFKVAIFRLLAIQAELENLRIDFKKGELNDNNGW